MEALIRLIFAMSSDSFKTLIDFKQRVLGDLEDQDNENTAVVKCLIASEGVAVGIFFSENMVSFDPVVQCTVAFTNALTNTWRQYVKTAMAEDDRLDITVKLLEDCDSKVLDILTSQLEPLIRLYGGGYVSNVLTSIMIAASYVLSNKQSIKHLDIPKHTLSVVQSLKEKEQKEKPFDHQYFSKFETIKKAVLAPDKIKMVNTLIKLANLRKKCIDTVEKFIATILQTCHLSSYQYYFSDVKAKTSFTCMMTDLSIPRSLIYQSCLQHRKIRLALSCYKSLLALQACVYARQQSMERRLALFERVLSEQKHYFFLDEEKIDKTLDAFCHQAQTLICDVRLVKQPPIVRSYNSLFWFWRAPKKITPMRELFAKPVIEIPMKIMNSSPNIQHID